ncbi:MAG: aminopeptidase P family N-terminal domain-containing protein, partial [Calditrichia bacterium]|nr:aminopeptidase P family N-terminal domain-containing protein [Calditrichia bacterium]
MTKNKIQNLRNLMEKYNIQAYLIPSTDPHQSEYVPELWERRKWLSGFTGSAGDLAFTLTKAGLWTDSRYFLQAEEQLEGSGIDLFKMGLPETPSIQTWLKNELQQGEKVGFDPRVFSYNEIKDMKHFFDKWKIELKSIENNLVDKIWDNQPGFPEDAIIPLK